MDIVKKLFPNSYKINKVDGWLQTTIVDAEFDLISIKQNEVGVTIDTKDYTYLELSRENLEYLLKFNDLCNQ
jgi:hypothetical protein